MTALYIGGAAQGKCALAQKLHRIPDDAVWAGTGETPAAALLINGLHHWVRQTLEQGKDASALLAQCTGKIIVCDEIGCGIVPLDAFEREWREQTGRLCCALAEQADLVVRVFAGIPQTLKGELPCR